MSTSGGRRSNATSRPMKRDTSSSACAKVNSLPRATTGTVRTPSWASSAIASGRAATSMELYGTPSCERNSFTFTQLEHPGRQYTRNASMDPP